MDPILATFLCLGLLLLFSVPIGVAIGFATLLGVWLSDIPLLFFTQRLFSTFDSFPLMAVPFFLLAGEIMQKGSLANSLLNLCRSTAGHLRGGLAQITILTCLFYGALSGSAAATTAAVGGTMIPAMEKDGYPKPFAAGINAAGGSLGCMIPPSIPLIVYGAFGGVSVSDLFIACIVPGVIAGIGFMLCAAIVIWRNDYGTISSRSSWKTRLGALNKAKYAIGVPVIVLGGIYGGITTPTEAGVVAVVYALIVELWITRAMTLRQAWQTLASSVRMLGMMFLITITATAFGSLLLFHNVQDTVMEFMNAFITSPVLFILAMHVILLILGCFMDTVATILILTPIVVPLAVNYGMSPVHFGIFMIFTLCIGYLTPPVGVNLFVACSISQCDLISLSKACIPFIISMIVCVLLVGFVPWFSLCLL